MLYNPFVKNNGQGNSQVDLSELETTFAEINNKLDLIINLLQQEGSQVQIQELNITPTYTHSGLWDSQITNFANITDSNNNTSTTFGQITASTNNTGYFEINLNQLITSPYSIIEFLIGIQNSNGQSAYWGLEVEQNGIWENIWGVYRVAPSSGSDSQIFKQLILKGQWNKLRFVLKDTGTWAPRLAIYTIKTYTIT